MQSAIGLIIFSICFSMLSPVLASENSQLRIEQANEYLKAALYEKAIPIYQQILQSNQEETPSSQHAIEEQATARYRLAQSYFLSENYQGTIKTLEQFEGSSHYSDGANERYLLGISYRKIGENQKSIAALKAYLNVDKPDLLLFYEEAQFETALVYFLEEKFTEAREIFSNILKTAGTIDKDSTSPRHLFGKRALIFLARIAEINGDDESEKSYLSTLKPLLADHDILRYELAYLQGEAFFRKTDYNNAITSFKQALPENNAEKISWYSDILHHLGSSYIHLALSESDHDLQKRNFDQAEEVFLKLSQHSKQEKHFLALAYYYLIRAECLKEQRVFQEAENLLSRHDLFLSRETQTIPLFLKAKLAYLQSTENGYQQALLILDFLIKDHSTNLNALEDPDEIYFLQGLIRMHLHEENWESLAEKALQQGLTLFPDGKFSSRMLNLLGTLAYQQNDVSKAKIIFLKVASQYDTDLIAGEALFWAAQCTQDVEEIKCYRRQVYERYPHSPFAAEAYFLQYTYQDYLQGDRAPIKHLQAMPAKFPDSLFVMNAWYLIGLDHKRDRKTPEGKWICRRNLTASIDAFQEVESTFDTLFQKGIIKDSLLEHYVTLRYRASLERALANLTIAEESEGAKREIYLEYAIDVFQQIAADFKNPQHLLSAQLTHLEACVLIRNENAYWLAHAYLKANQDLMAEKILTELIARYQSSKVTRGYFLAQAWVDLGLIATNRQDYKAALNYYQHAEDASKGKVLNQDQRLDLWIQQSLCYQSLGEMDQAILLLSKVVNDDAISGLRIKAMYLRAELYELQGRSELARKQLIATSLKGGEWSFKAKTKLDNEYGYH